MRPVVPGVIDNEGEAGLASALGVVNQAVAMHWQWRQHMNFNVLSQYNINMISL